MNTASASHAEPLAQVPPADKRRVLIWDAPVRVFHWLAVVCFAGAWLTAESEHWRLLHVTLGYTLAGLVAFRVVWGLIGTRHARFSNFVRGPAAVAAYLRGLWRRDPAHSAGHNPAGALAIVAMLGLVAVIGASGWALYNDLGGDWLEEAHELAANAMLLVIAVHVAGVLISSRLHRQNLVGAMVTGHKAAPPAEAIRSAHRAVAVLMLVAVAGFWAWQWSTAPAPSADSVAARSADRHGADHGHDDDDGEAHTERR
jgi:cytochrome b